MGNMLCLVTNYCEGGKVLYLSVYLTCLFELYDQHFVLFYQMVR